MPDPEKNLMDAVGESFGIQDQQQPTEGQDGDTNAGSDQHVDTGASESDGTQPAAQQPGQQQPAEGADGDGKQQLFTEKPKKGPRGELLDAKGNVIAGTRREKQLAFNLNRAQYAANLANREVRRLQEQVRSFSGVAQAIRQSNLSPQLVQEAIALRARAEAQPIETVREIVAKVLASGVTMEQIFGNDAVPAINARIVTNELDRRLGPLERREQQAARAQRIEQQAGEQLEDFLYQHEHAAVHGVEISRLVEDNGLTPEKAYYEIRSWAERRGLDFSQPLGPQLQAKARARGQNGGGRQPSTPGGGGRSAGGAAHTSRTSNQRGDFRSDAPWRDIAQAVFSEVNNRNNR